MQKQERQSLITDHVVSSRRRRFGQDVIAVFAIIAVLLLVMFISMFGKQSQTVFPVKIALPWFQQKSIVMQIGTSRVLEPLLYSGYDQRNLNNFKSVTQREVQWSVDPQGIITVDMYGRINAIKEGQCSIKITSLSNSQITDSRIVSVVSKRSDIDVVPQRIIKFQKGAAQAVFNYQKIVQRLTKQQVSLRPDVPQTVKIASLNPFGIYQNKTTANEITWQIRNFSDGSDRRYVIRINQSLNTTHRDRQQYFIGDRYIPDEGHYPVMIQNDEDNRGLWIVGRSGNTTHIKMLRMTYSQKSDLMNAQTQKFVKRHGLASGARWDGQKWIPEISDNDGLWTAMYGAGQFFRYAVLKQRGANQTSIAAARQSALKSLKAVLLTAHVAGREGKIQAKIRHLNNTRMGNGVTYSHQYLLEGKPDLRDVYVGRPIDGISFFGVDAGKNISGNSLGGNYRYSSLPLRPEDWSSSGNPATTQRNLDSFMSRTFVIAPVDPPTGGGLFFRRSNNQTHTVISGANILYDYTENDHPQLKLGNKPIPEVLKSLLNVNGTQYNISDLIYKGDTSTDEVIGHLFIYKVAYDILNENDGQQRQLRQLIRETMRNFCQHLINNGYRMVDATGQATKWTKLYRQFYLSDYTIQDASLKAIQLLMSLKLTYYVTGQRKWKDQYDLLTKDEKFRYIDLMGMLWNRWVWAFTKCDDRSSDLFKLDYGLNPSQTQIQRHTVYQIHFSDQEQAYLAYYLAMQLEEDQKMREKYRDGMNGYWHSISKSQNPLWYYVYQLGYPDKVLNDSFGNDIRQVASWQLSRHMVDTRQYQAYIKGSRPDVIHQGPLSVNPAKIIGKRTSQQDAKYVNQAINRQIFSKFDPKSIYEIKVLPADQRSIHKFNGATFQEIDGNHNPLSLQPSTTFTLPYWLGVYHRLIEYD